MGVRLLATAAVFAALILAPAQASASEQVVDGSFDSLTTCTVGDCTSPVWSEASTGSGTGPLCQSGTQSCTHFQGAGAVGPLSGTKWAQMGGESATGDSSFAIQQFVNIPTGGATLSFQLSTRNSNASVGTLTVRIDGAALVTLGGSDAGYHPVSVDVSSLPGTRALRFEVSDIQGFVSSDSFNIDNVSLVDSPPAQAAPAAATTPAPTAKKCPKGKKLKKGQCRKKKKRKR